MTDTFEEDVKMIRGVIDKLSEWTKMTQQGNNVGIVQCGNKTKKRNMFSKL